ncbi:hypothetical protein AY601_2728 [Pedobacter cryoconitis]|uniref:Major facilitator superfamily (MFS) profile domain-containing protein n=1 Tax=Pedobacter cryoconitis TaxID=188932 RepID=A0A127VE30_9SPHI|nr:hypothetical protein [Pedobacter cryoconitis]AMP99612.1 hypothetical protein AY601_2728 [Pedobacter cryoconitis]
MIPLKRQILLITVIAAAIMELIDTSSVNVALNYMRGNLRVTLEDISWVITISYPFVRSLTRNN